MPEHFNRVFDKDAKKKKNSVARMYSRVNHHNSTQIIGNER